ncbi:winged helix-turn-helix transcriptional regulator [Alicyclobacillus mali]|uniref:Winged helix-turn-helix transcriptional regulator n=1 Tax=Alicyclobacillus mali (ex Roth et al. 2021) TaxID=1123961 RepID=A0ABS0F1Y8_9BACL|nr:metalloregulator ArsR/SmtB family transcription factor [Alicyclobacillus mali (ex Roth et al. 2021)]MBF8377297.1 winged helix-turn-helix transcriptional regulator [Alicyclobacillus mali (ex Roth et al. 2021)]
MTQGVDTPQDAWMKCLAVLGEPQRLRILRALAEGEQTAGALSERLGVRQNTLSHHMRQLREHGLVEVRRHPHDERYTIYRLNGRRLRALSAVLMDWAARAETEIDAAGRRSS